MIKLRRSSIVGLAASCGVAVVLCFCAASLFGLLRQSGRGELIATSVSPDGTWQVRVYEIGLGAAARNAARVEVVDLSGGTTPRDIYFGGMIEGPIQWKGASTVVLNGRRVDVAADSGRKRLSGSPGAQARAPWSSIGHGPSRSGQARVLGPRHPTLLWTRGIGESDGGGRSSPAVGADGTVYAGGGHNLWAFSPEGEEKWAYETDGPVQSPPSIDTSGNVYFTSADGNLYALNPEGKKLWSYALPQSRRLNSSPAIADDGTVYVGNDYGQLFALTRYGVLKWQINFESPSQWGPQDTPDPAISPDGTILFSSRWLHAVDENGTKLWTYRKAEPISPPVVSRDGTVYFVDSGCERFHAADVRTGREKWSIPTPRCANTPALDREGNIYFVSEVKLISLTDDGRMRWSIRFGKELGPVQCAPVIDADGTIYAADFSEYVYAVHPSGKVKWEFTASTFDKLFRGYTRPISEMAIGLDGTVYFNTGGSLIAVGDEASR